MRTDRNRTFQGFLLVYLAWLLFRAWQARNLTSVALDGVFQGSGNPMAWLRGLVWREAAIFGSYVLLGLLIPPATGRRMASHPRWQQWLAWGGFGIATIAACTAVAWNALPPPGALLLPFAMYLTGAWLGSAASHGPGHLARAVARLGILLLVLVAMAALALRMAVATAPLVFDATGMDAEGKRQLAQRIRAMRLPEDQPQQLRLTDTEINSLLHSMLDHGSSRQVRVEFAPTEFVAQASVPLPRDRVPAPFLNVQVAGRLSITEGRLDLSLQDLMLGRLGVPGLLRRMLSSSLYALLMDDPQTRRIIHAITRLDLQPGTIDLVFQPGALGQQVVPSLAQLLWARPDVAAETGIHLRHLLALYPGLAPEADRFGRMIQGAFALAGERSADNDPIVENRAALLALAILFGHPDLEPFVGDLLEPVDRLGAQRMIGSVTLRGRPDWARHFLVSAALVLLSNESASDRIGLLKEQLDAQDGGSGFSFADKLANFAGNRLAAAAVRDESSAREVQARLAQGFDVDAFFPPADGLAEGISAADFASRYGGLDGPGYRQVIDEINRRLGTLPPL